MQFHQLYDSYESYELNRALPSSQLHSNSILPLPTQLSDRAGGGGGGGDSKVKRAEMLVGKKLN